MLTPERAPGARRPRLLVLASTYPAAADDGTPGFVRDIALIEAEEFDTLVLVPRVAAAAREERDRLTVRRFRYFPRRWENLADGAILEKVTAAAKPPGSCAARATRTLPCGFPPGAHHRVEKSLEVQVQENEDRCRGKDVTAGSIRTACLSIVRAKFAFDGSSRSLRVSPGRARAGAPTVTTLGRAYPKRCRPQ